LWIFPPLSPTTLSLSLEIFMPDKRFYSRTMKQSWHLREDNNTVIILEDEYVKSRVPFTVERLNAVINSSKRGYIIDFYKKGKEYLLDHANLTAPDKTMYMTREQIKDFIKEHGKLPDEATVAVTDF
jgi:hypothetical protein